MERWQLQGRDEHGRFTQGFFAERHPAGMSRTPYGWRIRLRWRGRWIEGGYWRDPDEARQALAALRGQLAAQEAARTAQRSE